MDDENTDTEIVCSKTAKQLADHCDKMEAEAQTTLLTTSKSTAQQHDVNRIICGGHASVATPTVVQVQPVWYLEGTSQRALWGAPLILNLNIAFPHGFVGMNPHCTGGTARFLPPPTLQAVTHRLFHWACLLVPTVKYANSVNVSSSSTPALQRFGMGKCKFTHCARCLMQHTGMELA